METDEEIVTRLRETLVGVTFTDEDGSRRPMAEEMKRNQRRGIVASSEY